MNVAKVKADGRVYIFCPGCKEEHGIVPGRWTWNGDFSRPTFSPSVLVTSGHYCDSWKQGDHCWCTYYEQHPDKEKSFSCQRCHSFVEDGNIRFLSDCSHELAGQTVALGAIQ